MPAWVDAVEYGKFGRAKVTATLVGGMDASLYADFKKDVSILMNASENTLKAWLPAAKYPVGMEVVVHYNPQKPSESVLHPWSWWVAVP